MRKTDLHNITFELPRSHIIAWLDIISADDFSKDQIEDIAQNHDSLLGPHETGLKALLEHITAAGDILWNDPETQITALHIACARRNHHAVTLFLFATYHLYRGDEGNMRQAVLKLLSTRYRGAQYATPFAIAIYNRDTSILRTLLQFEKMASCGGGNNQSDYISQQWSYEYAGKDRLLHLAFVYLHEDTLCELIKIGRPKDIDVCANSGRTALHLAASHGWSRFTRDLVELYGAKIDIQDRIKRSPSFYAWHYRRDDVFAYLKKKGARGTFSENDRSAENSAHLPVLWLPPITET